MRCYLYCRLGKHIRNDEQAIRRQHRAQILNRALKSSIVDDVEEHVCRQYNIKFTFRTLS